MDKAKAKQRQKARIQELTLAAAVSASERITPEALEKFLHGALQVERAYEIRLNAARAVGDTEHAKRLENDEAYKKAIARRNYFLKQLAAQFPKHVLAKPNLKIVERQVIISEYLGAMQLKRDAQIQAQAARELKEEAEKKIALQDMQRALKYCKYFDAKFKRFQRELEREKEAGG